MRCNLIKRATQLLALLVPATFAATYTLTATHEGELYYAIYNNAKDEWATDCSSIPNRSVSFNIESRRVLPNYDLYVFTDASCQNLLTSEGISFSDL